MKLLINHNYLKTFFVFVFLLTITACAGKGKADKSRAEVEGQPPVDMTRPPVTIKNVPTTEDESNPDEIVSFEKWSKEQKSDD